VATERVRAVRVGAARPARAASTDVSKRRGPLPIPAAIAARLIAAGLAGVMGWIHIHLWSNGYRQIHIIGFLFLVNGIISIVLAVGLLIVPGRFLGPLAAGTSLFTAGTLAGLVLSINVGLFGWKEFLVAPFVQETLVVESVGIAFSALLAVIYAKTALGWWHGRRTET
jgi:hypothetical protein